MNGSTEADLLADAEYALRSGDSAREVARAYLSRADRAGVLGQLVGVLRDYEPGAADDLVADHLLRERANGAPGADAGGLVNLSDVEPETVRWLWPDRVPLGKLTMLDGDPGLGKSTLLLDLAARLSVGASMPDGSVPEVEGPVGTVLLTAEDGLADTVRPRLDAAGGDPERVVAVNHVPTQDGEPRLPHIGDADQLYRALESVGARLVVVDPLMAYLPSDVNSHRDQDVRRALAPLADLADETGVSVVAVRHLNKSGGSNPKYRGGGSIGLIGAARSGLLVAEDPDAPERRVLAPTKSNLAQDAPSLTYKLVEASNGSVAVSWEGESEHPAEALLETKSADERTAQDEAVDFLRERLRNGPVPVSELKSDAQKLGVSWRTFRRAKSQLGVEHFREGGLGAAGRWSWQLTNPDTGSGRVMEAKGVADFEDAPEPQGSSENGDPYPGQGSVLAEIGPDSGRSEPSECRECGRPIGSTADRCGRCKARD